MFHIGAVNNSKNTTPRAIRAKRAGRRSRTRLSQARAATTSTRPTSSTRSEAGVRVLSTPQLPLSKGLKGIAAMGGPKPRSIPLIAHLPG